MKEKMLIASDMPKWLKNIIKKISYEKLDFSSNLAIKLYMKSLPQRQNLQYDVEWIETSVSSDMLNIFNMIEYNDIRTSKANELEKFLTDYVKKNGLV